MGFEPEFPIGTSFLTPLHFSRDENATSRDLRFAIHLWLTLEVTKTEMAVSDNRLSRTWETA